MQKELSRPYILFGGDYNPDQWDEATIRQDMEYFHEAGVNTVTLPVFSWAKLEPSEGKYCFEWLDRIIDILDENKLSYFLATPTSAQPAWLSHQYPEVLPTDIAGRKRTHGMRVFFCYNSEKYRERAAAIAHAMAERYKGRPGLIGWHVANEYGTYCYCDNCQKKFRLWLKERYGTLQELNDRWHTDFWGKTLYSYEEIMLPTERNDDYRFNPAVQLDYMRFVTDSTIECYENEAKILKSATPQLPVFTNISGFIKKLNQYKMVSVMDCAGWDNYPWPTDERSFPAMKHDIMRGLKDGESYYVMEQSPNQQNWQPYNKLKRPGEIRKIAYQGLAHGSDSSLYFQMRQTTGGQEKFHGALITHNGRNDTRIFREMSQLGKELAGIGDCFICGKTKSQVGILFDWESWWALELCSGPTCDMNYLEEVHRYYKILYKKNIPVDFVMNTDAMDNYKVLVAPMLYMLKPGVGEKINQFVKNGGTLIATYMTGYADENDRCIFGAYPGPLRESLGLWVEETDALRPEEHNSIHTLASPEQHYECGFLCDIIRLEGAKPVAVYDSDFYQDLPAVTVNSCGEGKGYYLASRMQQEYLEELMESILAANEIEPEFSWNGEVEITSREKDGRTTWFVINHDQKESEVDLGENRYIDLLNGEIYTGKRMLAASDVLVLASQQ